MSLPADPEKSPSLHGALDVGGPVVDRRGFLTTAGAASLSAMLVAACGGGDSGSPTGPGGTPPTGISRDGNTLRIDVAAVSTLQGTNGFVIVAEPPTIVVNLGNDSFRAFTARCTHQGCIVANVSNRRINCLCHGSAFDADGGQVLSGPATQRLRSFPVSFASATRVLTVTTS